MERIPTAKPENKESVLERAFVESIETLRELYLKLRGERGAQVMMHTIAIAYIFNKLGMLPPEFRMDQSALQPTVWVNKREHDGMGMEIISGYTRPVVEKVKRVEETNHLGDESSSEISPPTEEEIQ